MTNWFSIAILLNAAREVIISGIFGSYADRRLTQAALDSSNNDKPIDLSDEIIPKDNKIWVDFVADVGDGFDSTYAIAYLLAMKDISIDGKYALPRGQMLIMGGDQVYSTPTKENYSQRLEQPYSIAFPKSVNPQADRPPVFLIPGNHDWYDGLNLFLAKFCRGIVSRFGSSSWELQQSRSYFAIKLPNDWWIWGVDVQLDHDIDLPQENYFKNIAESISQTSAKIILCTSEPTWLYEKGKFYKGIDHIASKIIHSYCKNSRIYTILSGDLHHYNRYEATDTSSCKTQFITAGGGGAFLHPTHQLDNEIANIYFSDQLYNLKLANKISSTENLNEEACYPSKKVSKKLALSTWKFPLKNTNFCFFLGFLYFVLGFLVTMLRSGKIENGLYFSNSVSFLDAFTTLIVSPISVIVFVGLSFILYKYALHEDEKPKWTMRLVLGFFHALFHFLAIILLICIVPILWSLLMSSVCACHQLVDWIPRSWSLLILLITMVPLGGLIGGIIWGLYFVVSCGWLNRHHNDAFSSMKFTSYKNFLRICIENEKLIIYPIGLENVPEENGWECNSKAGFNDQNQSKLKPKNKLQPILIEGPITISFNSNNS